MRCAKSLTDVSGWDFNAWEHREVIPATDQNLTLPPSFILRSSAGSHEQYLAEAC
jgi:hypothetical protein